MKNKLKHIIKIVLLIIIQFIEYLEYFNVKFKENDDISDKIIDTIDLTAKNLTVNTPSGYVPLLEVHKTKPYYIYYIETNGGLNLQSADNHLVVGEKNDLIFVKDLKIGYKIKTKNGIDTLNLLKKKNISYLCMIYQLTQMITYFILMVSFLIIRLQLQLFLLGIFVSIQIEIY